MAKKKNENLSANPFADFLKDFPIESLEETADKSQDDNKDSNQNSKGNQDNKNIQNNQNNKDNTQGKNAGNSSGISTSGSSTGEAPFVRVIALDETGKFENLWAPSVDVDFRCIGGIYKDIPLVDGKDAETLVNEELVKMYDFLKGCIDSYNTQDPNLEMHMPESLHGSTMHIIDNRDKNDKGQGKIVTWDIANSHPKKDEYKKFNKGFNNEINSSSRDYLLDNDYHMFVYVLSKDQLVTGDHDESNIVDYKVGANLYQDMLIRAVNNLIFYDFSKTIKDVYLFMATRTLSSINEENIGSLYDKGGEHRKYITSTNYIKTALMHKVNNDYIPVPGIHIGLDVKSIQYYKKDSTSADDWLAEQKDNSLLYMADIACGIIRQEYIYGTFGINKMKSKDMSYEESLVSTSCSLPDEDYDVRFISQPDRMLNQMIVAYYKGELADYYSVKYDLERRAVSSNESVRIVNKYYKDFLVKQLDDTLSERLQNDRDYQDAVINRLPAFYSTANGFMGFSENKYEKGGYVALNMLKVLEVLKDKARSKMYIDRHIFGFNDIIVRCYNHRGDISRIKPFLDNCDELSYAIGLEEYLEHKQRAVQKYFNALDFDFILEEYYKNVLGDFKDGKWNLSNLENLKKMMEMMCGRETQGVLLFGKIYSTVAQTLSFKRLETAEHYFDLAIKEMGDDRGNIDITRSYRMHHFCDMAEAMKDDAYKQKFEEDARTYFEIEGDINLKSLVTAYDNIMKYIKNVSELRFALFLYVKALKVFYLQEYKADQEYKKFVNRMASEILSVGAEVDDLIHPWELIYMNVYYILDAMGDEAKSGEEKNISRKSVDMKDALRARVLAPKRIKANGPTIAAIIYKFALDISEGGECPVKINKKLLKDISGLSDVAKMSNEEIREVLDEKMTYMYV